MSTLEAIIKVQKQLEEVRRDLDIATQDVAHKLTSAECNRFDRISDELDNSTEDGINEVISLVENWGLSQQLGNFVKHPCFKQLYAFNEPKKLRNGLISQCDKLEELRGLEGYLPSDLFTAWRGMLPTAASLMGHKHVHIRVLEAAASKSGAYLWVEKKKGDES